MCYGNDIIINKNCDKEDNSICIFPENYQTDPTHIIQEDYLTGNYYLNIHRHF